VGLVVNEGTNGGGGGSVRKNIFKVLSIV